MGAYPNTDQIITYQGGIMTIQVLNLSRKKEPAGGLFPWGEDAFFYIGREFRQYGASPLGNPFKLAKGASDEDRLAVVEAYSTWLDGVLSDPTTPQSREIERIVASLLAGNRVALGCWCAPKLCHGNVVEYVVLQRAGGLFAEEPTRWGDILKKSKPAVEVAGQMSLFGGRG